MLNFKRVYVFLFIFLFISNSYASNYHEHLYSVFTYEDFKNAEIKKNDLMLTFQDMELNLDKFILLYRGVANKKDLERLYKQIKSLAFYDVVNCISDELELKKEIIVKRFFVFDVSKYNMIERPLVYQIIEKIRKAFILQLSSEDALAIYEAYLLRVNFGHRTEVRFSVPSVFFYEKLNFLKSLQKLFKKYGTEVKFFMGIGREKIANLNDHEFLNLFNISMLSFFLNEKILNGIDISGSIREKDSELFYKESLKKNGLNFLRERFVNRLKAIFLFNKMHDLYSVIHAFEATNNGDFYDLFYKSISDNLQENGKVFFVHTNFLTNTDLEKLEKFIGFDNLIFCNNPSNASLFWGLTQGKQAVVTLLRLKGYNVLVGLDGVEGIMGISFLNQHRVLKKSDNNKKCLNIVSKIQAMF